MRFCGTLLWLTGAFVLSGCSAPEADRAETLVVYSAGPRPLAEAVVAAWEEKSGHQVELYAATTGQVMARLEAERYRPRADVVVFASALAAEAIKARGGLKPYRPDGLDATRSAWHHPEHYYLATSAALVGVALREDGLLQQPDWPELFSGDAGQRLTMPSPSRSGAAGEFVLAYALARGDGAWEDFRRIRADGLEFAAANSQAISGLLQGAYQGIVGAVDYLIYRQISEGAPLRMHYPEGGSALVVRPIAIMADARAPHLAQDFVAHYLSPEMQQKVAEQHLLPAREDTAVSETRGAHPLPPTLEMDFAEALNDFRDVLRRFQIEVERAEVVRGDAVRPDDSE